MIFDKDIDKTLWIILNADKKNRNRIIEFLRNMPNGLQEKIIKSIELYREYENDDIKLDSGDLDSLLSGNYETQERILYWYEVDGAVSLLKLGCSVFNGKKYEEAFELILEPFDNGIEYFEEEYIGSLDYDITENGSTITCNEIEYNIVKTPFGTFVVSMLEDRKNKEKLIINRVNLRKMPDEIFVTDFENSDSVSKLVRRRMK